MKTFYILIYSELFYRHWNHGQNIHPISEFFPEEIDGVQYADRQYNPPQEYSVMFHLSYQWKGLQYILISRYIHCN